MRGFGIKNYKEKKPGDASSWPPFRASDCNSISFFKQKETMA